MNWRNYNEIEFHTISFDENIIFKHFPKMINLLIGDCKITAKEYLKSKNIDLDEIYNNI